MTAIEKSARREEETKKASLQIKEKTEQQEEFKTLSYYSGTYPEFLGTNPENFRLQYSSVFGRVIRLS